VTFEFVFLRVLVCIWFVNQSMVKVEMSLVNFNVI